METIQLNEEIQIKEGDLSIIVLLDYKHKKTSVFKTYEDKMFTEDEVLKYSPLIVRAGRLVAEKTAPKPAEVKQEKKTRTSPLPDPEPVYVNPKKKEKGKKAAERKDSSERHRHEKECKTCHEMFIPTGYKQSECEHCRMAEEFMTAFPDNEKE